MSVVFSTGVPADDVLLATVDAKSRGIPKSREKAKAGTISPYMDQTANKCHLQAFELRTAAENCQG